MKTTLSRLRSNWVLQCLMSALMLSSLILLPSGLNANPTGPSVVVGGVSFNGLGTPSLTVTQGTQAAIINWNTFSIGSGEVTQFVQPNAAAIAVNRVITGNPTAILGQLKANGRVMVINPNGIMVGPGGLIDTAGLTFSTLDASNSDLLDGGSTRFSGNSTAGIYNYGTVRGQDVIFLANHIQNSGSITGYRSVAMGVGGEILVDQTSEGATISVRGGGAGGQTGIDNSGNVTGGNVTMESYGNVYSEAINNSGAVRATGYNFSGGRLTLRAGSGSRMINTGNLYARRAGGAGGQINVSAGSVELQSGNIDAAGDQGKNGGEINVEGTNISVGEDTIMIADGVDGGSINLNATNQLDMGGTASSRGVQREGGNVDFSAAVVNVESTARVDVSGLEGGRIRAGGGLKGSQADIMNSDETNVARGAILRADGSAGDGGEVILWSDGDTMYAGEISARATGMVGNGGFVEVSGKSWLTYMGLASTSAANGITGTLLLDPTDVFIGPAGTVNTITDGALVAAVLQNNVVIHTSSPNSAVGNITIQAGSDIQYDSPNSLSFFANNHIFVDGDIKNHGTTDNPLDPFNGTGHISLVAGWDGAGSFGFDPTIPNTIPSDPNISAADIIAGTYGAWGTNGGSVFINDAALEAVEVGSARGETNVFGNLVTLTSGNSGGEFAQIGYRRENDIAGIAISGVGVDGVFNGAGDPGPDGVFGTGDDVLMRGTGLDGLAGTADDTDDFIRTGFDLSFDTGVTGDINVYSNAGVFMLQHQGTNNDEGVKNVDRSYVLIGHGGIRQNDNDIEEKRFDNTNGGGDNMSAQDLLILENSALGFTGFSDGRLSGANGNIRTGGNLGDRVDNLFTGTVAGDVVTDGNASLGDYGSDLGNLSVGNGDNHGNITVNTGGILVMQAARAEGFAQIGHGGSGADDPDHFGGIYSVSDRDRMSNNNARSRDIFGNMTGNISVTASSIDMEGGRYNLAPVQIGHGGMRIRGNHGGNLDVTTTGGGIRVRAAPDSASGGPANSNDWRWLNNRDQSYAQIGHGGFDSDFLFLDTLAGYNPSDVGRAAADALDEYDTIGDVTRDHPTIFMDARPRRTILTDNNDGGTVLDNSIGNTSFAGDGIAINNVRGIYNDADGVSGEAFGHFGNINVTSAGRVEFVASNGTDAYAMLGHGGRSTHGDHVGNISINANGSVIFTREAHQLNDRGMDITNRGHRAHVQVGHGGTRYQGGSTGDITILSRGNVEFYGGRSEAYAQVGHGGRGEDSSTWNGGRQRNEQANGTHSGNITVQAAGDIKFRSGFTDVQAHSMIGHGGYFQHADVYDHVMFGVGGLFGGGASAADQVGHNGDIVVTSGGDISFIAGQNETLIGQNYMEMNGGDNFTMIGHGGRYSKGDHWGNITINSTGDFNLEARGGWDAVTIENNNGDSNTNRAGTPRLNSTEDNGRTGYRNFAQVGHGGFDAEHYNLHQNQSWNNSGMNGDGIGVLGPSDINMTIGGDLTVLAAMKSTTQDKPMPIRVFDASRWDTNSTAGGEQRNDWRDDTATTGVDEGQKVYVDENGNVVDMTTGLYSQFNGRLDRAATIAITDPDGDDGNDANNRVPTITITDRNDGEIWDMPDPVLSAEDSYAMIGNGGRATDYRGSGGTAHAAGISQAENIVDGLGHRGNITINVTGDTLIEASDIKQSVSTGQALEIAVTNYQGTAGSGTIGGAGVHRVGPSANGFGAGFIAGDNSQDDPSQGTRNFAMIGLGGDTSRGDHNGTIDFIGGGDLNLIAGEGRQAFAQIGIGGYDSDRQNSDNSRGGDIGQIGDITIDIDGKLTMAGGGLQNGDTTGSVAVIDPATGNISVSSDNDIVRGSYVQIGNGGMSNGGNHTSNIDIVTGTGVDLTGGTSHRGSYGMIGSGGTWGRSEKLTGNISVVAETGDINLQGGMPTVDDVDDGTAPANAGNVQTARESYVQIGNGGWDTDAQGGNRNNVAGDGVSGYSGDITVIAATGSITIQGGGDELFTIDNDNGRGMYAKIGHGGGYSDGDTSGDIRVTAGVNLTLRGGYSSETSAAHIGHSYHNASSDISGTIDIDVGNDLIMERGPRFNARGEDVRDAFAKIGHSASIFQGGGHNNGGGTREGDIFVSIGRDLYMRNGYNLEVTTAEDVSAIQAGGGATYNLLADTEFFESTFEGSLAIQVTHPGGDTFYVDDGNGNIVLAGTTTVVGTIDYNSSVITMNANISEGGTATAVVAHYATDERTDLTDTGFGSTIGHINPRNTGAGFNIGAPGDTFIAVGRNDPGGTGPGGFIFLEDASVITSADGGLTTELRFYTPNAFFNNIETGAWLNNATYNRDTIGGVGNRFGVDEHLGTEHTFVNGTYGEPSGTFGDPPEGDYPFNALGLYNIYYVDPDTLNPPDPPAGGGTFTGSLQELLILLANGVPVDDAVLRQATTEHFADLGLDYPFPSQWETFEWQYGLFEYDGYEGLYGSLGISEAIDDGTIIPRSGIEAALDAAFGPRKGGLGEGVPSLENIGEVDGDASLVGRVPSDAERERDEENERREQRALRQVGQGLQPFYLYEPGTNTYSSLRIFGVPSANVPSFNP